jgi:anthranilate phosphoribosyltransferase
MRKKISVIGSERVEIAQDLAAYADLNDDVGGADVVVLAGEADLDEVCERAPAAVLLVTGDSVERRCRQAYEATLFPRARIIGTAEPAAVAESIVLERGDEHDVVAMTGGEFSPRRARVGRGGIRELL